MAADVYGDGRDWSSPSRGSSRPGLPNNPDAEANVLAAMLLSPDVIEELVIDLREEDFYRPSNRTLFVAIRDMYNASIPVDAVSLVDYLKSVGKLDEVGGEARVVELMDQTFSLANWQHHASIVRRDSMLRDIIGATNQISALAYDAPTDTKEVVERAESLLLTVTQREVSNTYQPLTDFMKEAYEEAREIAQSQEQVHGVPTGFPRLDNYLMGFRGGQLVIVGARPAMGKTSFALNLALNAAEAGYTVCFFSLEMSGKEIAQRLMCAQAMVSISSFRTGRLTDQDWDNLGQAAGFLEKLDILIDDTPGISVTEIRAKTRRMLHGKEKAVVFLDYLQLVSTPAGFRADDRVNAVAFMSRSLKIMAKELDVPVIALSQLSRQVENRTGKRPQLSDLRESGSIEQDADMVMMIDRSTSEAEAERDDRPDPNVTRIIVAKNRSGPVGDVDLMFIPQSTKFYELDDVHEE